MKRKLLPAVLCAGVALSLCGCGIFTSRPIEPIPTEDDEVYEQNDKDNISFTEVTPKETTPSGEVKEEKKKENGTKIEFSDVDEDGNVEYAISYEVKDGDIITGAIELYLNNELIYETSSELLLDIGKLNFEDYDGDGEKEIFFSYYPRVNSMPLEEYVVLKKTGNGWNSLKVPKDKHDSNNFPVHIKYGEEACKIIISCDGYEKEIEYDAKAHYENAIEENKDKEDMKSFVEEFERMLSGDGYEKGKDFGTIMPWGLWSVESVQRNDKAVLKAEQGIAGTLERYDFLGNLFIYFTYDEKGEIKIEDMEFFDAETYGVKE